MSEQPEFLTEYLEAYRAANPGNSLPGLKYVKGWVEFRQPYLTRYRRKQIEAMTKALHARVAAIRSPSNTETPT